MGHRKTTGCWLVSGHDMGFWHEWFRVTRSDSKMVEICVERWRFGSRFQWWHWRERWGFCQSIYSCQKPIGLLVPSRRSTLIDVFVIPKHMLILIIQYSVQFISKYVWKVSLKGLCKNASLGFNSFEMKICFHFG